MELRTLGELTPEQEAEADELEEDANATRKNASFIQSWTDDNLMLSASRSGKRSEQITESLGGRAAGGFLSELESWNPGINIITGQPPQGTQNGKTSTKKGGSTVEKMRRGLP